MVRSVNFKKLKRYTREALVELEGELGLKRVKVDLPRRGRGGRRSFLVWATSVRIDVEAAKREHRYALDHVWAQMGGERKARWKEVEELSLPEFAMKEVASWRRGPPGVGWGSAGT